MSLPEVQTRATGSTRYWFVRWSDEPAPRLALLRPAVLGVLLVPLVDGRYRAVQHGVEIVDGDAALARRLVSNPDEAITLEALMSDIYGPPLRWRGSVLPPPEEDIDVG